MANTRRRAGRNGFTLVELLVVIGIIGTLIALLLPAVQASRESASRTECANHLKQMATAIQQHVEALGVFPTGGDTPWPVHENYFSNGQPNAAAKQGLGWAYQILPYLELENVYRIPTQAELEQQAIGLYFCPSRRLPTQQGPRYLMDYAAATPGRITVNAAGKATHELDSVRSLWGGRNGSGVVWEIRKDEPNIFDGVIVRINWWHLANGGKGAFLGGSPPTAPAQVTDGLSNTMIVGEKCLCPSQYATGAWHDDRGWSDGWDPDVIRSTSFAPHVDSDNIGDPGYRFGSAHHAGFNVCLADGSVRLLHYDIDRAVFNCLGDRRDGQVITPADL